MSYYQVFEWIGLMVVAAIVLVVVAAIVLVVVSYGIMYSMSRFVRWAYRPVAGKKHKWW